MTVSQLESVEWCLTCSTQHGCSRECPGELAATSPEQHGWRVNVETPRGFEAYGVLIARSDDVWRARILTFPNVLWIVPGSHATMKFVGKTPREAERQAAEFIKQHCVERNYLRRDGLVLVEPDSIEQGKGNDWPASGRDAAPRKIKFLPVVFGVQRPIEPGITGSLSTSGLSVLTQCPCESGVKVRLSLTVETERFDLSGSVVWSRTRPEEGRAEGMGIQLDAPPPAYVDFVQALH